MYRIDVDAKFLFHDGAMRLQAAGMDIDLNAIQTIEQWRQTLMGLAVASMADMTNQSLAEKTKEESPAERVKRQQDDLQDRSKDLVANLRDQHADLIRQYEDSVASAVKQ